MSILGIALASDSVPATLPKGFLEQLSTLEAIKNEEFDTFIQFIIDENKENKMGEKIHATQPINNENNTNQEDFFDVN